MDSPVTLSSDALLAEALVAAVLEGGEIILDVRRRGHSVERKADLSPVTEADRAAETAILKRLAKVAPDIPVIAEEAASAGRVPSVGAEFFLVDPLDGTKEFIKGGNDFTVNIGLIRGGEPVIGVILVPATGQLFCGVKGEGAWKAVSECCDIAARTRLGVIPAHSGPYKIVASRSHRTSETDVWIRKYEVEQLVSAGSSLKFCLLAAAKADFYPRLGPTMQWDTAAGDAILRAAGGKTLTLQGKPLSYGPGAEAAGYLNPCFVATGGTPPLS